MKGREGKEKGSSHNMATTWGEWIKNNTAKSAHSLGETFSEVEKGKL